MKSSPMRRMLPVLLGLALGRFALPAPVSNQMLTQQRYARWLGAMSRIRNTPKSSRGKPSRPAKHNGCHRNKAARSRRRAARLRAA